MAEDLSIVRGVSKELQYQTIIPQIKSLIQHENDVIANLANMCAALKEQFNWFWVGFYLVKGDELVLGPFQGPVACTRIAKGKGVCGTAWLNKAYIVVPNVDEFPNHIACSSVAKSEIVIPIFRDSEVVAVLDVDSEFEDFFDEIDVKYLLQLINIIDY